MSLREPWKIDIEFMDDKTVPFQGEVQIKEPMLEVRVHWDPSSTDGPEIIDLFPLINIRRVRLTRNMDLVNTSELTKVVGEWTRDGS